MSPLGQVCGFDSAPVSALPLIGSLLPKAVQSIPVQIQVPGSWVLASAHTFALLISKKAAILLRGYVGFESRMAQNSTAQRYSVGTQALCHVDRQVALQRQEDRQNRQADRYMTTCTHQNVGAHALSFIRAFSSILQCAHRNTKTKKDIHAHTHTAKSGAHRVGLGAEAPEARDALNCRGALRREAPLKLQRPPEMRQFCESSVVWWLKHEKLIGYQTPS